jgi:CheY-like chemotaxis protein
MYGLEVLAKLRELNPQLPVIIVTADIQKSTRELVRAQGAVGMLSKPIQKEDLSSIVQTAISGGIAWS